MTTSKQITHRPRASISHEEERDVRARVWKYVFDCYAKKKTTQPSSPDEAKVPKPDQKTLSKPKGGQHDLTKSITTESF
jgi:hypothetical protein